MKRDVRAELWAEHNQREDARLVRWGYPWMHWEVRFAQHTKHGRVRWEAQLGYYLRHNALPAWNPRLFYYYPTKAEALAKGVELVLKGYAGKVVDG